VNGENFDERQTAMPSDAWQFAAKSQRFTGPVVQTARRKKANCLISKEFAYAERNYSLLLGGVQNCVSRNAAKNATH
jgi:hypothetical protein